MVMKNPEFLAKLVSDFAHSVIAQDVCVERDDVSRGNEFAKKYIDAAAELLSLGRAGIDAFASLLQDERIEVRTTAASYLLPYRTEESVAVLEESSKGAGV